jgi:hypothetical protein
VPAESQPEWRASLGWVGGDGIIEVSILINAVAGAGRCFGLAAACEGLDDDQRPPQ